MDKQRRSLLEKYAIPISYLDFAYVKGCKNAKELEKILIILRSGEEGYYPDLTQFAEDKLREIKPTSKILRTEEELPSKDRLTFTEWNEANQPFMEWSNEIKVKDKFLSTISEASDDKFQPIPPIRGQLKKIEFGKKESQTTNERNLTTNSTKERIKSTDYRQWDKYDPDTEVLKMDLEEERIKEEIERKNKINIEETQRTQNVANITEDSEIYKNLTNVEKESLSRRFKERGNDYFKSQEHASAVEEYTRSLRVLPSAAGYNNRAVAYLKLKEYSKCIDDCNKCLQIEPKNVKALLRKAQGLLGLDKRHEAFNIYTQIISIEPSNVTARHNLNDLKSQICFIPSNATRIEIQDKIGNTSCLDHSLGATATKETKLQNSHRGRELLKTQNMQKEEDLSKLIIPKKIVKSKLATAVQSLGQLKDNQKTSSLTQVKGKNIKSNTEIQIFDKNTNIKRKNLIQEIKEQI